MVRSPAPDVRPGFVIGTGSRRPLLAETRVMDNAKSRRKLDSVFCDAIGKT
jgi:hypothetical protein